MPSAANVQIVMLVSGREMFGVESIASKLLVLEIDSNWYFAMLN